MVNCETCVALEAAELSDAGTAAGGARDAIIAAKPDAVIDAVSAAVHDAFAAAVGDAEQGAGAALSPLRARLTRRAGRAASRASRGAIWRPIYRMYVHVL